MDGISRTWGLMKQSFLVLTGDAKLIVFPILSGLVLLAIDGAAFRTYGSQLKEPHIRPDLQPLLFMLYWMNYFVVLFFNSALMACAYLRIAGGTPTLGTGLRTAWDNIGRLFLWSFVAASVGSMLQLREQHRGLRRLIGSTLELAWSLGTFFILPVLLFEDTDVWGAFTRSADLFRQQWGGEMTSNFSFGVLYLLLALPAGAAPILFAGVGLLAGVVVMFAYLALMYLVMTAVQTIFVVELYRYASRRSGDSGFAPDQLQNAFS